MADISIANFLNRNTRTIAQIVDQTFKRLLESTGVLDPYMPTTSYMDRMLLLIKFKAHRPTIAQIVAEEQEIPPTRARATMDEQLIGNLKLGKKIVWKACDYELLERLSIIASQSGPRGTQMETEIKRIFFGLIADMVPAINDSLTVRAIEVATTGASVFTDPLTGARVNIQYTPLPNMILPVPAAARRWNIPATATPLADLETHSLTYFNELVEWPNAIVMRFNTLRDIANSNEAKVAYLRAQGADSTTPDTTGVYLKDEQVIDMIKTRVRCQSVQLLDAYYSEEVEGGGDPIDRPFLPDNTYFFAKPGYMERAYVPTIEKNFEPGIFQHTKVVEEAPRQERSVAVANGVAFVPDDRDIAARRVA